MPESLAGPERDSLLSGLSPEAETQRRAIAAAIVAQLEAVDSAMLDPREAIVHAVLLTQFRNASGPAQVVKYGAVFADYGNWFLPYPVTQLSGPQIAIPGILEKQQRVASSEDADAYLARLAGYDVRSAKVIANRRRSKTRGRPSGFHHRQGDRGDRGAFARRTGRPLTRYQFP